MTTVQTGIIGSEPFSRWGWAALFILVPLAVNPFSKWQYEPDKAALVLLLASALAGWTVARGGWPRPVVPVERWLAAYVGVRWLSTARSVLPHWSLWGDPAYGDGLWLLLAGALIFGQARRQLTTPARRAYVLDAILTGSALVAGYALLEALGLDVLGLGTDKVTGRVASTQAHANFLAAYLAMTLPLALGRWLVIPAQRVWLAGLLIVQGAALLLTYSRTGWLAAGCGVAVVLLSWLWRHDRRRVAAWLAAGLAAGVIALVVLALLPPLPGDAPHALQTFTSLLRWKGATAQIRLLGWEASVEAIRARPWLGSGPATYRAVLEWVLPPELAPFQGASALGGRPHNVYLEVAVESGLVGLALYLGLLAAIVRPIGGVLVRERERAIHHRGHGEHGEGQGESGQEGLAGALLGSLVAYLVTGLFSFDTATTLVLFWGVAGMAHAAAAPVRVPDRGAVPHRWGWAVAGGGIALAALILVPGTLAGLGEARAHDGDYAAGIDLLRTAAAWSPVPEELRAAQGWLQAEWATQSGEGAHWAQAAATFAGLTAERPVIITYHKRHALVLRRWHAQSGDPALAERALAIYTALIPRSPRDPDLWLDRGLVRLVLGDTVGALADFEQANAILPDYARYYGAMAGYALAAGDRAAAAAWNAQALDAQARWDDWVWRR